MNGIFVLVGAIVFLLILAVLIYNGLIAKKNKVEETEGTIDVMLKQRHDLIPGLVETVKQYTNHEAGTLTKITELRNQLVSGDMSQQEKVALENKLSSQLAGLKVNFENYPDLKASANFLNLQGSLNEVEAQLSASRRSYNAAVLNVNKAIESFPSNLFAKTMNLYKREYYEIPEEQKSAPDIKNLFS